MPFRPFYLTSILLVAYFRSTTLSAEAKPLIDKDAALAKEAFWDNRDSIWFKENILFFECPDAELTTTYYYRWELLTKPKIPFGSQINEVRFPRENKQTPRRLHPRQVAQRRVGNSGLERVIAAHA